MNKYRKFLFDRAFRFNILASRGLLNFISDKIFLEKIYQLTFHQKLSLDNPQTFNEKLQWLKLYDRNPLYTTLVDKYAVRQYIKDKIGEEYLIPLVGGPWMSFDQIDFDALPDQFVLKCTHDSGGLVICRDKSKLDVEVARTKISKSLKRNYYYQGREWPYKDVKPRIIAEECMNDTNSVCELTDYKFFCFNGESKAMFIATDRSNNEKETKFDFFDMDFNHLPIINGHPHADVVPGCPQCFNEMKMLADKLSKGIPQIRVDFYNVSGRIYFGELTLFHWSGMVPFSPEEWDYKFGEWIKLRKE
jgi:hypothetical protein